MPSAPGNGVSHEEEKTPAAATLPDAADVAAGAAGRRRIGEEALRQPRPEVHRCVLPPRTSIESASRCSMRTVMDGLAHHVGIA